MNKESREEIENLIATASTFYSIAKGTKRYELISQTTGGTDIVRALISENDRLTKVAENLKEAENHMNIALRLIKETIYEAGGSD